MEEKTSEKEVTQKNTTADVHFSDNPRNDCSLQEILSAILKCLGLERAAAAKPDDDDEEEEEDSSSSSEYTNGKEVNGPSCQEPESSNSGEAAAEADPPPSTIDLPADADPPPSTKDPPADADPPSTTNPSSDPPPTTDAAADPPSTSVEDAATARPPRPPVNSGSGPQTHTNDS